jgi:hypothetical protein
MLPILPTLWMWPGIIPILQPSGLIIPGQLGPTSLDLLWLKRADLTYFPNYNVLINLRIFELP